MKCRQLKKIEQYHHGELSDHELSFMKSHLEGCLECSKYLSELKLSEQLLSKMKAHKTELPNPEDFRSEILGKIEPRKSRGMFDEISRLIDLVIYILLQPITRYSFMTAAVIIFGVFIYQQTIIVQKIGSLEKRMETSVKTGDAKINRQNNVEAFFRKRSGIKAADKEFNELLEDYRLLLLKHKVLLKVLQKKYPETYNDILRELDEVDLLPENINI